MKLGSWVPGVLSHPNFPPPRWEREAGIEEMARFARGAEAAGFDFVCAAEHVAMPTALEDKRGSTYWDPLAVLGYIAAATERIGLVPLIVVLPYHHPLAIAKRYGTLDRVAGGRLRLGVGVGSLEEEFELLDADFDRRGARSDDALRALRVTMGNRVPSYEGEFYAFSEMIVEPNLRAETEIWVGGRTRRSLRRTLELGDVWAPFAIGPERITELLADPTIKAGMEERPIEIIPAPETEELDPVGDPERSRTALREMAAAGAHGYMPRLRHQSLDHLIEQLHAFAALARDETP